MNVCSHDSVLKLAELLRTKQISAEELVHFYLDRIRKYDGAADLNTIAELNSDVLRQAREIDSLPFDKRGALSGIPVLIKDNIDVSGLHTTAGSIALSDNIAKTDAPVVARLRQNGALILGKTNMTEFANYTTQNMPNGFSSHGGQVKNAYDREKDASGSSTGSAVAVSAGLCAAAIGTDTSFSVVGCATENGVTGYKPPHGTFSNDGIIPISRTLDSAGLLTRDVSDTLFLYNAMRDTPIDIKPSKPEAIRLAVNTYNRIEVSDKQLQKYEMVLQALRDDGGHVSEVSHPHTSHQKVIMRCEFRHDLEQYLKYSLSKLKTLEEIIAQYEANPQYMPYGISYLRDALDNATGNLDGDEYIAALEERCSISAKLSADLSGYDAVLMTGPTNVMHFVGFPSVALRLGMSENGHPRGMILYGSDERRLLSAALTLEQYCAQVPPPQMG